MDYNDVTKHLGACGLDCVRCADYEHGEIKKLSIKLLQALGINYARVAKMKSVKLPFFSNYSQFEEILIAFSQASCGGCRSNNLLCPIECAAKTCVREKSIDFCFQCADYPCEKQFQISGKQGERWMKISDRMKEIGVIDYYYEQFKLPRY